MKQINTIEPTLNVGRNIISGLDVTQLVFFFFFRGGTGRNRSFGTGLVVLTNTFLFILNLLYTNE